MEFKKNEIFPKPIAFKVKMLYGETKPNTTSIYKFNLSICMFLPINVTTAEPIGPKFCEGHHVTPGKVYG